MNSMSVSPVKPPLNPGNLAVPPATATNLSKSSLPPHNNFTALNLVPESKGLAPVPAASTTPEKSIELAAKVSPSVPRSNGSVSPHPDTGRVPVAPTVQNCSEKKESAENLSISSANSKTENTVEEIAKPKVDIEEKKDEKKPTTETKGSPTDSKAASSKNVTAQNVTIIEAPSSTESSSIKKDEGEDKQKDEKKIESSRPGESAQVENIVSSLSKKESTTESASPTKVVPDEKKPTNSPIIKKDNEGLKTKVEPVTKKKTESDTTAEPLNVPTENIPKATKRKAKTPVESISEEENSRKSKRTRLPTQPYQSPIPELQLIAKLNTPAKPTSKTSNEKIIAFYKNEFLAVRNPEGSFYICQAFQNIHRNSTKIRIRWFTNLPQNIYTPDFYDTTEFDCILTNVTMNRVEKDRWKLPDQEQIRIENILKRALDVEKGVVEPSSITEEHPDGLDLSLYKDEAQLQKKKKKKSAASPKKSTSPESKKNKKSKKASKPQQQQKPATSSSAVNVKKSSRTSSYVNRDSLDVKNKVAEKAAKKDKKEKKKKKKNKASKKQPSSAASKSDTVSSKTWEPSVKASNSSKVVLSLRKEDASAKSNTIETKGTKRTSSVSLRASAAAAAAATSPAATAASTSPAKRRKEEPKSSPSNPTTSTTEKTGKVRNAGSAVSAKINSAAMRTTKEKERKAAAAAATATTTASQRKK